MRPRPLRGWAITVALLAGFGFGAVAQADPLDRVQDRLNLTPQQAEQLQSLRQSQLQAFRDLLTPEQQEILDQLKSDPSSRPRRNWREELALDPEQIAEATSLRQSSRQQIRQILTPEQLDQLEQWRGRGPASGSFQGSAPPES